MKKEVENLRPDTVNMLLNPKNITGRNEGRLAPFILTVALIFLPIVFLSSYLLAAGAAFGYGKVFGIFIPLYIFYSWRIVAIILLNEKERLKQYKKEQIDKYQKLDEITSISRIHGDGAVEYSHGIVSYFILCKNGNKADTINRAKSISKFMETLSNYEIGIHALNIIDSTPLSNRYKRISNYTNKELAKHVLDIINFNKKYVEDNSLVTVTVFQITGRMADRQLIKNSINSSIQLLSPPTYREVTIADDHLSNYILNRCMTSNVDYSALFMEKYAKNTYYKNKVLGYDLEENTVTNQTEKEKIEYPWMQK